MSKRTKILRNGLIALAAGAAGIVQTSLAVAQDQGDRPSDSGDRYDDPAPPNGEAAPPPAGYREDQRYDERADEAYADAQQRWAAENCYDSRNNTAAGAVIGGVLGAIIGSGVAGRGDHAGGAVVGGALGAATGAAIGSSSRDAACPPGYVVRSGAPAFYYAGPVYAGPIVYPAWYRPWVFVSGRWVYQPYRYWYWRHYGGRDRRFGRRHHAF